MVIERAKTGRSTCKNSECRGKIRLQRYDMFFLYHLVPFDSRELSFAQIMKIGRWRTLEACLIYYREDLEVSSRAGDVLGKQRTIITHVNAESAEARDSREGLLGGRGCIAECRQDMRLVIGLLGRSLGYVGKLPGYP